jgi:hypothetical protein
MANSPSTLPREASRHTDMSTEIGAYRSVGEEAEPLPGKAKEQCSLRDLSTVQLHPRVLRSRL